MSLEFTSTPLEEHDPQHEVAETFLQLVKNDLNNLESEISWHISEKESWDIQTIESSLREVNVILPEELKQETEHTIKAMRHDLDLITTDLIQEELNITDTKQIQALNTPRVKAALLYHFLDMSGNFWSIFFTGRKPQWSKIIHQVFSSTKDTKRISDKKNTPATDILMMSLKRKLNTLSHQKDKDKITDRHIADTIMTTTEWKSRLSPSQAWEVFTKKSVSEWLKIHTELPDFDWEAGFALWKVMDSMSHHMTLFMPWFLNDFWKKVEWSDNRTDFFESMWGFPPKDTLLWSITRWIITLLDMSGMEDFTKVKEQLPVAITRLTSETLSSETSYCLKLYQKKLKENNNWLLQKRDTTILDIPDSDLPDVPFFRQTQKLDENEKNISKREQLDKSLHIDLLYQTIEERHWGHFRYDPKWLQTYASSHNIDTQDTDKEVIFDPEKWENAEWARRVNPQISTTQKKELFSAFIKNTITTDLPKESNHIQSSLTSSDHLVAYILSTYISWRHEAVSLSNNEFRLDHHS